MRWTSKLTRRYRAADSIVFTLLLLLSSGAPIDVAFAETASDYPAEAFIARGLKDRMFRDNQFMYAFQRAFRVDSHKVAPALDIKSGFAGQCVPALTVELAPDDLPRKWDGTIDKNAMVAASIVINLRLAEPKRTELKYENNRLIVKVYFLTPVAEMLIFDIWFRYGESKALERARYFDEAFSQKGGPFRWLFQGEHTNAENFYQEFGFYGDIYSTWYEIEEEQRDLAIRHLKAVFASCKL